ncbi:MAG: hypothetical protein KIS96_13130 [Bauldia sp.]|nr:hypothetical protein [Bauldia sp.]
MATAILAFFAFSWFGWAMEKPPRRWRLWLALGLTAAVAMTAAGIIRAIDHWNDGTVFDAATSRTFGIIVGVEFALAAVGAGVLTALGWRPFIPAWIAFIVGVHFFPLAAILDLPVLYGVAGATTLVALAAIPVAQRSGLAVSAVIGAGMGAALLAGSLVFFATLVF